MSPVLKESASQNLIDIGYHLFQTSAKRNETKIKLTLVILGYAKK